MLKPVTLAMSAAVVVMLSHGPVVGLVAGTQPPPSQESVPGMTEMHHHMMEEATAADAKLDQLVKDMNMATADTKVSAIVAVVNELLRQHKAMQERTGVMHQHMAMCERKMSPK